MLGSPAIRLTINEIVPICNGINQTIDLENLLGELKQHENHNQIPVRKVMRFIQRASALKRNIMQPQPLSIPA